MKKSTFQPPAGWQNIFDKLQQFRAGIQAPVDTIGCDKLFTSGSLPHTRRFQILVSLLLSSQTKDQVTAEAMRSLHAYAQSQGYKVIILLHHTCMYVSMMHRE